MQWSLVLLVLMGRRSLFTCQLFEYHFINKNMGWGEAQKYCREKHTDLVTVYEETDINRLRQSAKNHDRDAWTGLYIKQSESDKTEWNWRWSQAGVEYTEDTANWLSGKPNNVRHEYCVMMWASSKYWVDVSCTSKHRFICYDAENSSDKFYVSAYTKTWPEAQMFCRKYHTDLVSGTKQLEERISTITGIPYWIGLFRDPWRWSDGRSSFFRPWSQTFPGNQPGNNKCAALHKDGSWNTNDCNSAKPFFCYSDNVILIKENKTWEEAINHCRENYNDLISITDAEQQRWVQERAKNASSSHVWLALRFTCILEAWFWVTDERVDYKNWASDVKMDDCDMSGAMEARGEHKWIKEDDMRKFNFFCSKF
ncbi:C-type mannose receptor 2-like [Acanthopagrus latus]|uniref:C-type mannose receptor 2-like n=1 Tax=Acanthopagrus latus TaxID=8177 RepID=UPI00187BEA0C|nr:C-type mannose receptor 2-like [Acanthopagrus latus]